MKAQHNELYNFMVENEWRSLIEFTLKEIWTKCGISHPQKVKNWIKYLIKHHYLTITSWLIIATHDWSMCEDYINNILHFMSEYRRMQRALNYFKLLPPY